MLKKLLTSLLLIPISLLAGQPFNTTMSAPWQYIFIGGANVTLSTNGNTITITAASSGAGTTNLPSGQQITNGQAFGNFTLNTGQFTGLGSGLTSIPGANLVGVLPQTLLPPNVITNNEGQTITLGGLNVTNALQQVNTNLGAAIIYTGIVVGTNYGSSVIVNNTNIPNGTYAMSLVTNAAAGKWGTAVANTVIWNTTITNSISRFAFNWTTGTGPTSGIQVTNIITPAPPVVPIVTVVGMNSAGTDSGKGLYGFATIVGGSMYISIGNTTSFNASGSGTVGVILTY